MRTVFLMQSVHLLLVMVSTNNRGGRRAPSVLKLILSLCAFFLLRSPGSVVHSFHAPPLTTLRSSWRRRRGVPVCASTYTFSSHSSYYCLPGIARSRRLLTLQLATEDDDASASTSLSPSAATPPTNRDELLRQVVDLARRLGPVGVYQSQDDQDELERLAMLLRPYSDPAPAQIPLSGSFDLLYSASPYVSSGRLWGPVYGKVTQVFQSPNEFCNRVDLGPVRLSLDVTCYPKNDTIVQVNFVETTVSIFGNTVVTAPAKGGGEWKYVFAGTLTETEKEGDGTTGTADATTTTKRFIRVLEAPNLFVIEQVLPPEL